MPNKTNLVQIIIIVLTMGLFTQCNAQNGEKQSEALVNTSGSIVRPTDEARIEAKVPEYEIKETSLEYLQSLPMPEVQFVFESQDNSKSVLPNEIKNVLDLHWKEAIKFSYETYFNEIADGKVAYQKTIYWSNYCGKTKKKLQELFIDAPNGKRQVSQTEASELYGMLNKIAVDVMDKAKSLK